MLFTYAASVAALLSVAAAAPARGPWEAPDWISDSCVTKNCKVSHITSSSIDNTSIIDIGADPLIPFPAPKLSAINQTAWEFWYFDSTTDDGAGGISFAFWRDNSHLSPGIPYLGALRMQTQVVFPNGTYYTETLPVSENTISQCADGITGVWNSTTSRYTFQISNDLKYTTITVDSPTIKGSYELIATTPGVYPDGNVWPNRKASALVMPYVYWDAVVPSGTVKANFTVKGAPLVVNGVGGHDRNWASFPLFQASIGWQEARVIAGPYTLIFWNIGSSTNNKTYTSTVLLEGSKVVFASDLGIKTPGKDYLAFSQVHKNDTSVPFNPTGARTTFTLDVVSASKNKAWQFKVDFSDTEWAIQDFGFGGIIPAITTGGEVGKTVHKGAGTAMHAEFSGLWIQQNKLLASQNH